MAYCIALLGCFGCSKDDARSDLAASGAGAGAGGASQAGKGSAESPRERPEGPAADVSRELRGGNGPFIAASDAFLTPDGFVDREYVVAGTATSYQPGAALSDDGRWSFEPSDSADYRTRIFVRRPADAARASGTVIVEWLNVSGGADANPEYTSLQEEILRQGHSWIGVSAQRIGIEGGAVLVGAPGGEGVAGKGLKAIDPERYGSLEHPGDGFSFDIFTQVARAVLQDEALLGGAPVKVLLAAGESQSAIALVTYYDGVQPRSRMFDGFFIHSRGSTSLPLVAAGEAADLAGSIGSPIHPIFRDDLDTPVLDLQAEGDVTGILNSQLARQPDSEQFRLWEVAGTAHADAHLIGELANTIDCGAPLNDGPMHLVTKAAFRTLDRWVRTGTAPESAARLELSDGAIRRNADGLAFGAIRTPPVDVPVAALSGDPGPNPDFLCLLLGSARPLSAARLAELYPSRSDYMRDFEAAADRTIDAGFVLAADRDPLLAFAKPSRLAP